MRTKYLVGVLLSIAIAAPGIAQTTTASVVGNVRDKSGAAIPQAEVTAQNMETSFTRATISDETGAYMITNLPVGVYRVTGQKQGFTKFVQEGITLVADQNARVDLALSVGDISQSVTVTGESTGVETRSTVVGELVDRTPLLTPPFRRAGARDTASCLASFPQPIGPVEHDRNRRGDRFSCGPVDQKTPAFCRHVIRVSADARLAQLANI